MRRRESLAAVGGLSAVGLAGCPNDDSVSPTPSPEPSTLTIRVENGSDSLQTVRFQLDVTTPTADTTYLFRFTDVGPGETRTEERSLAAGTYRLGVTLPRGSTAVEWAGTTCAEKIVEIRFAGEGEEIISDQCLAED